MSLAKTWGLLGHLLLDLTNSKTQSGIRLSKARHTCEGTDAEFMNKLSALHIGDTCSTTLPEYNGAPNEELDAPFTEAEVRAEILGLKTKSAPGPDGIMNKILRNLDDASISALTEYMQEIWSKGLPPSQWKSATVILIPNPGKPPTIDNLRPISLTSHIGKLMKRVVQTRRTRFMEENLWPHEMVGLRPGLCTHNP